VLPLLDEAYIQTGKLLFVYKEYPVVSGNLSVALSVASQCAAEQAIFWPMHDWIFANASALRSGDLMENLKAGAEEVGLDVDAFEACMNDQASIEPVVADFEEGQKFGVRGTPNFVINGRLVQGLLPAQQFVQIIDALLAQAESGELPEGVILPTPTPTPDRDFEKEEVQSRGDPNAPITMVEFSDYQCPFCLRYFQETLPQLLKDYVETGKVYYVFKDFPITQIHPQAIPAAVAARCAGQQDAYWEMHDKLFEEQSRWNNNPNADEIFAELAQDIGLDMDAFNACVADPAIVDQVNQNLAEGVAAGVQGTPAFFINGEFISGAQPYSVFQQTIERLLAEK